jgi:hypothetical protein
VNLPSVTSIIGILVASMIAVEVVKLIVTVNDPTAVSVETGTEANNFSPKGDPNKAAMIVPAKPIKATIIAVLVAGDLLVFWRGFFFEGSEGFFFPPH